MAYMSYGEGEGEGDAVTTAELSSVAGGSVVATQWREDAHFPDAGGFEVSVSHGLDAAVIKLEATPKAASEYMFVGVFDDVGLVDAGFNPKQEMETCSKVIRGAFKAEMGMAAEFAANGDDVELHIRAQILYFEAHYTLKLVRQRVDAAASLKKALADFAAAEGQLADARKELLQSKASLRDATADGDVFKQQLAEAKKEIESLKSQLAKSKAKSKSQITKLSKEKAQATAGRRTAEQRLAETKAESDSRSRELKAAMAKAVSDSGAIIEELREALAKAKAAADRSAADDSREFKSADESDTRKKAKIKSVFCFDKVTKGGSTQPKEWQVSADGKSATAKADLAQIIISPPLRSDSKLTIEVLKKGSDYLGVGVTDDYSQWLWNGCGFYSDGNVAANGSFVASSQAFGDWLSGDRLFVTANLSSGTVSIRAPKGEYTAKWTPTSSPIWFSVYANTGTKLRLID